MAIDISWMLELLTPVFIVTCGLLANVIVMSHLKRKYNRAGGKGVAPEGWKRVLLVTSHPDDETMFFGPTIQTLIRTGSEMHVLCLSSGDADGLGAVRTKELESVKSYLRLDSVEVVDDPRLRDGFKERWPVEAVAEHVDAAAKRINADAIITFDVGGVSGHPNHVATHRGVLYWMMNEEARGVAMPRVWVLVSVNVVRKFLMFADVFASYIFEPHALVPAVKPTKLMHAMQLHKSQWVWYRKLFVFFSRYAYVNSLRRLR